MNTADRFRIAVEERDLAAIDRLFAEDVRFFSPVKFTPFEGLPMVRGLFRVLLRTFEDFRYVGELRGEVELTEQGPAESHVLVFRATVNGRAIHGIDLIQVDDQGLIKEFTVMVRPRSAVDALSEAVYAGLVADGLVPAP
ncbi:nuclear transport factor 2 family protein [Actinomadura craniellae]|uniref:Nuclear transport factor 2 family protein n=1 Tax=Actinomadura craniellae TaxID=2231787 RepID=A0A365HA86_9ACTN|nr:nuclear transport factor 2 family protein [Actinomadura craniellae]RAY15918.1 nuclear transport factor 2 family protein [Actinomadura craniellae]